MLGLGMANHSPSPQTSTPQVRINFSAKKKKRNPQPFAGSCVNHFTSPTLTPGEHHQQRRDQRLGTPVEALAGCLHLQQQQQRR